ncbi:hypothetical protein [Geodermatophilus sp. URMC 63]
MTDVQERIDALLRDRRARLPAVTAEIERWGRLDGALNQLTSALEDLRAHPKTPGEVRGSLTLPQASDLRREAAELIETYRVVQARLGRPTINIGVSGAARVGKSTLLQSMTGLGDDQIPTGSGIPVTAVRSRIYHAPALHRAVVRLHTDQSFLDEVVGPLHAKLGFTARATSLDEFRRWSYGEAEAGETEHRRRLEDVQRSLDTFAGCLTGGERVIEDLSQLRPWVAYPTNAELTAAETSGTPVSRLYLAVRDIRIDVPFPRSVVEQLGIVDLPGLGEIDPDAEQRHVDGLRNEVDVVLIVKRPVQGMAYWGDGDLRAVTLIDQARGFVRDRRDFLSLLVNAGADDDPHLVSSLGDDIRRQVNDGQDGRFITVYRADAASGDSVVDDLLQPLLEALATSLPRMDHEIGEGVAVAAAALAGRVRTAVGDVERALLELQRRTVAPAENLDQRVKDLREDLAVALTAYVAELGQLAAGDRDDDDFVASVEESHRAIVEWIDSGFGEGEEAWCRTAVRAMTTDKNAAPFTVHQLNRIRVEIGRRFGTLNDFFSHRLDEVWTRLAAIIGASTGELLDGVEGRAALERLAQYLEEGTEPCPHLSGALEEVLDIRLEYRTQLYPQVRAQLGDLLNFETTNPLTGERRDQITVETTEAGARQLFRFVTARAHQAAYRIRKSLLNEAVTPSVVVHAFAEQFEDDLIRSAHSEREFKRFARSYRDLLWPGVYEGIELDDARVGRVRRAAAAVADCVAGVGA